MDYFNWNGKVCVVCSASWSRMTSSKSNLIIVKRCLFGFRAQCEDASLDSFFCPLFEFWPVTVFCLNNLSSYINFECGSLFSYVIQILFNEMCRKGVHFSGCAWFCLEKSDIDSFVWMTWNEYSFLCAKYAASWFLITWHAHWASVIETNFAINDVERIY
jgi:hypothetical protein